MRRLKELIGNLQTTEAKLKLAIFILGAVIIIAAIGIGTVNATSTPQFCSSCHEMNPEFQTWQVSSHAGVSCIDCHIEPGLVNLARDKIKAVRQVYKHVTNTVPQPITMPNPMSNESCESCHDLQDSEPAGDLIVPHEKHVQDGVLCVQCHSGIAHANIVSRGVLAEVPYDQWNQERARQEVVIENVKPDMLTCTSCHDLRGVANDCASCHQNPAALLPGSHQQAGWPNDHGAEALKDYNACKSCHQPAQDWKPGDAGQGAAVAAGFARNVQLCSSCHVVRPAGHGAEWIFKHKEVAGARGMDGCLVCHDRQKPEDKTGSAATYCNACHTF